MTLLPEPERTTTKRDANPHVDTDALFQEFQEALAARAARGNGSSGTIGTIQPGSVVVAVVLSDDANAAKSESFAVPGLEYLAPVQPPSADDQSKLTIILDHLAAGFYRVEGREEEFIEMREGARLVREQRAELRALATHPVLAWQMLDFVRARADVRAIPIADALQMAPAEIQRQIRFEVKEMMDHFDELRPTCWALTRAINPRIPEGRELLERVIKDSSRANCLQQFHAAAVYALLEYEPEYVRKFLMELPLAPLSRWRTKRAIAEGLHRCCHDDDRKLFKDKALGQLWFPLLRAAYFIAQNHHPGRSGVLSRGMLALKWLSNGEGREFLRDCRLMFALVSAKIDWTRSEQIARETTTVKRNLYLFTGSDDAHRCAKNVFAPGRTELPAPYEFFLHEGIKRH